MHVHTLSRALGHKAKQEIRKSHSLGSLCNLSFLSMCRRSMITSRMNWSHPISSKPSWSHPALRISSLGWWTRSVETQDLPYSSTIPHVRMWENGVGDYRGRKEWCKRPICSVAVIPSLGAANTCACISPGNYNYFFSSSWQRVKLAQKVHFSFKNYINCQLQKNLNRQPQQQRQGQPPYTGVCLFPSLAYTHLPPDCRFAHLPPQQPPSCCSTPAGGAMGAHERRPPSPSSPSVTSTPSTAKSSKLSGNSYLAQGWRKLQSC